MDLSAEQESMAPASLLLSDQHQDESACSPLIDWELSQVQQELETSSFHFPDLGCSQEAITDPVVKDLETSSIPTTPTEQLGQLIDPIDASALPSESLPSEDDYHTLDYPMHAWGQRVRTRNQRYHSKRLITSIIDEELEDAQDVKVKTRHAQASRKSSSTRRSSLPSSHQDSSRASSPNQAYSSHDDGGEISSSKKRANHRKVTAFADVDTEYRPMVRDRRRHGVLRTYGQRLRLKDNAKAELLKTSADADSNGRSHMPTRSTELKSTTAVERVECVLIPAWKKPRGKPRAEDTKAELPMEPPSDNQHDISSTGPPQQESKPTIEAALPSEQGRDDNSGPSSTPPTLSTSQLPKASKVFVSWWLEIKPSRGTIFGDDKWIVIQGYLQDVARMKQMWHSSFIVDAVEPNLISTVTGSYYRLEGMLDTKRMESNGFSSEFNQRFANGFPGDWNRLVRDHFEQPSLDQKTRADPKEDITANETKLKVGQEQAKEQTTEAPSRKRKEPDDGDSPQDLSPHDNGDTKISLDSSGDHSTTSPFRNNWRPKSRPGSMYVIAVEIPARGGRTGSTGHPASQTIDDSISRGGSGGNEETVASRPSKRKSPFIMRSSNIQVVRDAESDSPATSHHRNTDQDPTNSLPDQGITLHPSISVYSGPPTPVLPIEYEETDGDIAAACSLKLISNEFESHNECSLSPDSGSSSNPIVERSLLQKNGIVSLDNMSVHPDSAAPMTATQVQVLEQDSVQTLVVREIQDFDSVLENIELPDDTLDQGSTSNFAHHSFYNNDATNNDEMRTTFGPKEDRMDHGAVDGMILGPNDEGQDLRQPSEIETLNKFTSSVFKTLSTISASSQSSLLDFEIPTTSIGTALNHDLDLGTIPDSHDPITNVVALKDTVLTDTFFGSDSISVDQVPSLSIFGEDFALSIRQSQAASEDDVSADVNLESIGSLSAHSQQQEVAHDNPLHDNDLGYDDHSPTAPLTEAHDGNGGDSLLSTSQLEDEFELQESSMEMSVLLESSIDAITAVDDHLDVFTTLEELSGEVDRHTLEVAAETVLSAEEKTGKIDETPSSTTEEVTALASSAPATDTPLEESNAQEGNEGQDNESVGEVNSVVSPNSISHPTKTKNNLKVARYASVKDLQAQARMMRRTGQMTA
ncbi:MAG: hypothetical protein J3Q66DRAFT_349584 [Benniella sp.]|nr:MAG: hypothetical protein J3Q66DRAFT_349584 [Benniella sp.]